MSVKSFPEYGKAHMAMRKSLYGSTERQQGNSRQGKTAEYQTDNKTLFSTYLQPLFLLEAYRLIMEHLLRSFLTLSTYLKYEMKAVRDKGCSSGLSFSVSALFSVRDAFLPFHLGTRRITYSS